jgi:hypothetical protein
MVGTGSGGMLSVYIQASGMKLKSVHTTARSECLNGKLDRHRFVVAQLPVKTGRRGEY